MITILLANFRFCGNLQFINLQSTITYGDNDAVFLKSGTTTALETKYAKIPQKGCKVAVA